MDVQLLRAPNVYEIRGPAIRVFSLGFPVFALDRIWVSPASALVGLSCVRTALTRIASDHLPLKATLRAPGADGAGL